MGLCRIFSLTLFLFATLALPQGPSQNVQKRVSPEAYTAAPATIRAELKRQRCELPETQHWDETRLNIVPGHFGERTQNDWAAICIASDGSAHVLVFWGKLAPCPAEIRDGWALRTSGPEKLEVSTCLPHRLNKFSNTANSLRTRTIIA
jgi:hypothetical protein